MGKGEISETNLVIYPPSLWCSYERLSRYEKYRRICEKVVKYGGRQHRSSLSLVLLIYFTLEMLKMTPMRQMMPE